MMIKLRLGREPTVVAKIRKTQLPLAIAAFNLYGADHVLFKKLLDKGYQVARPDLHIRQHGKCAFCEKTVDRSLYPVEHFRPKKSADDKVGGKWVRVNTHYWWLAWTWSNLYFACADCNASGRKGCKFPIMAGGARIATPPTPVPIPIPKAYFDVSAEQNLLLNPRKDDPHKHLLWIPTDQTRPKAKWSWTIDGLGVRGDMTIEILELGRREDEVNTHLNAIKLLWLQVEHYIGSGNLVMAKNCWDDIITTFIRDKKQPFRHAARCALDSLCPSPQRKALGWPNIPVPVG